MNRSTKLAILASMLTATTIAGLLTVGGAQASGAHRFGGPSTPSSLKLGRVNAPRAFDPFWKLKNPGGPVELNPQPLPPRYLGQGLQNPGEIVGFNPQPDPPGYY